MPHLVLASNNFHKLKEIQNSLVNSWQVVSQQEFAVSEIEETATTFVENALLKAHHAAKYTKLPVIADDSGLIIDSLNGEPGIYSARFAGLKANDHENNIKVLKLLEGIPENKRTARFHCTIVCLKYAKDPSPLICQADWEGKILLKEQGTNGFGYDPIFFVSTHNCSAAELSLEEKNKISHRGQALKILQEKL